MVTVWTSGLNCWWAPAVHGSPSLRLGRCTVGRRHDGRIGGSLFRHAGHARQTLTRGSGSAHAVPGLDGSSGLVERSCRDSSLDGHDGGPRSGPASRQRLDDQRRGSAAIDLDRDWRASPHIATHRRTRCREIPRAIADKSRTNGLGEGSRTPSDLHKQRVGGGT